MPALVCASGRKATGREMSDPVRLGRDDRGELDRPILRQRKLSADPDITLESVGQDLCKERQRNGRTLLDVSLEIKIPPHHLIAIENGCFEALPGRIYAIGFVRSYAAYLGLDAEKLVDRLKAEMAGSNVKRPVIAPSAPHDGKDHPKAAAVESGNPTEFDTTLLSPPERRMPQRVI